MPKSSKYSLYPPYAPETSEKNDTMTVYFYDTKEWGEVNCYYWLNDEATDWPGEKMTLFYDGGEGKDVYTVYVPAGASVIFTNGSEQTVDVTNVESGKFYSVTTFENGKWNVG